MPESGGTLPDNRFELTFLFSFELEQVKLLL